MFRLVTEQGRPSKEIAAELRIRNDTLRNWLKTAEAPSPGQTGCQNQEAKRAKVLKAESRMLRKQLAEKDKVVKILKNP